MTNLAPAIAALVAFAAFAFFINRRLLRYLHIYQQDEYDSPRFLSWLARSRVFDTRVSLALLATLALWFALREQTPGWLWPALCALIFVGFGLREPDPKRAAKKPLNITNRARLIWFVALAFALAAGATAAFFTQIWGWVIAVQLPPLCLALANLLLSPLEARTQRFYWNDAHRRLQEIDPGVIGVTGSFGKTSVKHMLGHVLAMNARAFFTPGSVNTPMGVSRVIREQLPPDSQYFIVEMGAYGVGSIARLCRLAPPDFGVITALGEAHYERFKDLDAVARAKFELAEAVLAQPNGKLVIHASVLNVPYARDFVAARRDRFVVCGETPESDIRIASYEQTPQGLTLHLAWEGNTYTLSAPLHGAQHVGNLAVVFGSAVTLGITPERILAAARSIPQIKHRLEVKPQGNGAILIDDAYNSNPIGFTAALETLTRLAEGKRRRVLVTPGMVELGEKHDAFHAELGAEAAKHADIAIIVRPERIPTFVDAFTKARGENDLVRVPAFSEARQWLNANTGANDVILLENDLPDLYERKLAL